jgi:hypothetical protein
LLLILLIYIIISLTSVMGFKFLSLGACHLATLYLGKKWCEVLWLLFEAKGGLQTKQLGEKCSRTWNTAFFSLLWLRKFIILSLTRPIDPNLLVL